MCEYLDSPHVMPGYACCQCRTYNGIHRGECKNCKHPVCSPFTPDTKLNTVFETRKNHQTERVQ